MKKAFLIALVVPLLGVNTKPEITVEQVVITPSRPTIEQREQILKNKLGIIDSRMYVKISELDQP